MLALTPQSSTAQRTVLIAVIAGLLSLLLFVRVPGNSAWLRAAINASHAPIIGGVAVVLAILLRSRRPRARGAAWPDLRRYVQAFALATAVGVLIELLQSFMSRPPSLFDVGTDAAGAAIGLCLLGLAERTQLAAPRAPFGPAAWTLVACALAGALFVIWQPVQTARAYAARAQRFPVLAEFGDSVPLPMTRSVNAPLAIEDLPAEWTRRPGERALRVRYQVGKSENAWPIRYLSFEPSPDWRGYATLALELVNPSPTELQVTLRILDETHHWEFDPPPIVPITLPPSTRTTARIALDAIAAASEYRAPDLARVESLVLVPTEAGTAPEIYLLALWLER